MAKEETSGLPSFIIFCSSGVSIEQKGMKKELKLQIHK